MHAYRTHGFKPSTLGFWLVALAAVFLLPALWCFRIHAGDAASPGADPAAVATALGPVLDLLAGRYGWLPQVLTLVASLRAVLKPIFTVIHIAHSDPHGAALDVERAPNWYRLVNWLLDFVCSVKLHLVLPPSQAASAAGKAAILALCLIPFGAGCASNSATLTTRTTATNGVVTEKITHVRQVALWPATSDLTAQKAVNGTVQGVNTQGLHEEGAGGTNGVAALEAAARGIMQGISAGLSAAK